MVKAIILLLLLVSLTFPVSAEDIYQAKIVVSGTQGVENNWISELWDLNESVTQPFMDTSITFIRIGSSNQTGWFSITGSGITNPALSLIKGSDGTCVRGLCKDDNNVTGNEKSIKLTLIDIKQIHTATSTDTADTTTNTTDNPIYAYVYYDRELPMAKGKTNNFNGEDYVKQTGWTTDGGVSEVSVYFKRRDTSIPMSITVKAQSNEPKVVWSDKTAKYTIDSNGKYEFTIKYETQNTWGWKEEFTEVYTLITTGMRSSSSNSSSSSETKPVVSEAPYEVNVDSEFIVPMSTTGAFEKQTGVTITDAGNRRYAFTFDKPGQYDMNFKSTDGGSAIVKFAVKDSVATTTTKTTANQAQTPQDGGDNGSILWYLLLVIGVIGLAYLLIFRKKKSAAYHLHPKTQ